MLAISRNIFILFSAGLIFLLVGCGVSTEDVEATVQARIASIPTPTAQIVIQEVEVVVTATPIPEPTATPVPPEKVAVAPVQQPYSQETLTEEQITACIERGMNMEKIDDMTYADGPTCVEMLIQGIEKFPLAEEPSEARIKYQEYLKNITLEQLAAHFAAIAKEGQEYLSLDTTTVTENLPHVSGGQGRYGGYFSDGAVTFTDNLVTNTHPDSNMWFKINNTFFDDEGFFVRETNHGGHCIRSNETWRYRERTHVEGMDGEDYSGYLNKHRVKTEIVASVLINEEDLDWLEGRVNASTTNCYNPTKKEIDESLLDEVEVIITVPPLQQDGGRIVGWGTYNVEIKNRSANQVKWQGEYEIKDEFGYIIHRAEPNKVVGPNQRQTFVVDWGEGRYNMHTSYDSQGRQNNVTHVVPHCLYVDEEGNQCSRLGVEFPTLVTTHLVRLKAR